MVSVLVAIAAFAGVALIYKLATAGPNPAFDRNPYPDPDSDAISALRLRSMVNDGSGRRKRRSRATGQNRLPAHAPNNRCDRVVWLDRVLNRLA